jgi:hypothetical protein
MGKNNLRNGKDNESAASRLDFSARALPVGSVGLPRCNF